MTKRYATPLMLLIAGALSIAPAHAELIYATDIDWQNNGTVSSTNDRNDSTNALGALNSDFLSLGLSADANDLTNNPGFAVFKFDSDFGNSTSLWEVSFNCIVVNELCASHQESIVAYAGNDYNFGSHSYSDVFDDFDYIGALNNGTAQTGATLEFSGTYTYLAIFDTSKQFTGGGSSDGFDINAVGVKAAALPPSSIPEPMSVGLMSLGLFALGATIRRRKSKQQ